MGIKSQLLTMQPDWGGIQMHEIAVKDSQAYENWPDFKKWCKDNDIVFEFNPITKIYTFRKEVEIINQNS